MVEIHRFDIVLVSLDPTQGAEIQKTRPCVVISPDEMNKYIRTVIVAPITSKIRSYPTRIPLILNNKEGNIVLDQIRTIDKSRIIKQLSTLDEITAHLTIQVLVKIFS